MEVIDYAGGVTAVRVVTAARCDLRFERAGISLGILIGCRGRRLGQRRTEAEAKEVKTSKNKSPFHRAPSVFAFSFPCTNASELRANGSVVISPSQWKVRWPRGAFCWS